MLLFNTNNRYNGNKFTIILSKRQLKLEKSIKKLISASYQKNNTGGRFSSIELKRPRRY